MHGQLAETGVGRLSLEAFRKVLEQDAASGRPIGFKDVRLKALSDTYALVCAKLLWQESKERDAWRSYEFFLKHEQEGWRIVTAVCEEPVIADVSSVRGSSALEVALEYWRAWSGDDFPRVFACLSPSYKRAVSVDAFTEDARRVLATQGKLRLVRACAPDVPVTIPADRASHAKVKVELCRTTDTSNPSAADAASREEETFLLFDNGRWWVDRPIFAGWPPWVKEFRSGAKKLNKTVGPAPSRNRARYIISAYLDAWRGELWGQMYDLLSTSARESWSASPAVSRQIFTSSFRDWHNQGVYLKNYGQPRVVHDGPDYIGFAVSLGLNKDLPEQGIHSGPLVFYLSVDGGGWKVATELGVLKSRAVDR